MSRIAVVTSSPPMAEGGHMVIARELTRALREAGHDASIVVTPQNRFGRQASAYIATWLTDVSSSEGKPIDQVISLRYPSYAVRHPRHVCWLNHTMREYYDLWTRFKQHLSPQGRVKESIRWAMVHAADRYLLTHNVTRLFVQSRTIQQRLAMWPELRSTVLYPPAPQRTYRCDGREGPFLFLSRLEPLKRADLAIRAVAAAGPQAWLEVVGDGVERAALQRLATALGVAGRVTFAGRLSDDDMVDRLARCRAVIFPPVLEDFGFVTVEAFASRKAVITCADSGGPAELVRDGVNGFVCESTPESLAGAMTKLLDDSALAERLGEAAFDAGSKLTWPETIKELVQSNSA
jgi:glycosyltransferase involved in cell wall biosynthesis